MAGRDDLTATLAKLEAAGVSSTEATLRAPSVSPLPGAPSSSLPSLALPRASDARGGPSAEIVLGETLGSGGMAVVHAARQRSLDREVAVKRARSARPGDPKGEALLHEARVTGRLEHPNVVPVHLLGLDEHGAPAMVMKRVEGVAWRTLIEEPEHPHWQHLGEDRLGWHVETLMQVCQAVGFAHERGVVHRDLKPENVMIGRFGEVYVLDWGIAAAIGERAERIAGTPAYMAPEMILGETLGPTTDVYLLGATLHEVLTGSPPHAAGSLRECVLSITGGDVEVPAAAGAPPELASICARACRSAPERRFESARALRQALAAWTRHRESAALTDQALARLDALVGRAGELDDAQERRQSTLASECRFALRRALEIWEDNGRAADGLSRLLRHQISVALDRERLDAAVLLRHELGEDAPELDARIARLRAQRDAAAAEAGRLRAEASERDLTFLAAHRSRFLLGLALLVAGGAGALALASHRGFVPTYPMLIFGQGGVLALIGVVLALRRLRRNLANRQALWAFFAVAAGPLLVRTVAWRYDLPLDAAFAAELVLYAIACPLAGVLWGRAFYVGGAVFLVALGVGLLWPGWFFELTAVSVSVGLVVVARAWLRPAGGRTAAA